MIDCQPQIIMHYELCIMNYYLIFIKNFAISKKIPKFAFPIEGKMPEWPIGTVSKTVVPLRVPRVRIPLFPQIFKANPL